MGDGEMIKVKPQIDLFSYRDYRAFLRDWYRARKKASASFSFRTFSKRAGFASPNFLKLVMDNRRDLTEDSLPKFIKGLQFKNRHKIFFENLVHFNQSKTHTEKSFYYERLLRMLKPTQIHPIEKHQYEYFSEWYHPVIRELVISKNFNGSYASLSSKVNPPITPRQAKKSVQLLEKLGLIEKDSKGRFKQSAPSIATAPEVGSVTLMNYHLNMLDLTKHILMNIPSDNRDISAVSLGISRQSLPTFKKEVQKFRDKVLKLASLEKEPEDVIQINIQLFPLTQPSK